MKLRDYKENEDLGPSSLVMSNRLGAALGCLSFVLALGCRTESTVQRREAASEEFTRLHAELDAFADTQEAFTVWIWKSPAGRQIASMGKRALPFIIEEIRSGNSMWIHAAAGIVMQYRKQGMTLEQQIALQNDCYDRNWLEWWEKERRNPEWNVYLHDPQGSK